MSSIFETQLVLLLPVIGLVLVFAYHMYYYFNPQKTEEARIIEEQRKKEVTRIITSQKNRELTECIPEEEYWQLIAMARDKAKDTYKARLGILRDILSNRLDPEGLLRFDNRHQSIIEENINQDILAAATLLMGQKNLNFAVILMNVFILEGEVFFKNACLNPDLIIGKNIQDVIGETIDGHVADLYFRKTNEMIPLYQSEEKELKIPGEEWEMRDLPERYPNLWEAFA